MAQYDQTPQLARFFDSHLLIPLLQFHENTKLFSAQDLQREQLRVLETTSLTDSKIDLAKKVLPPEEFAKKESQFKQEKSELRLRLEKLRATKIPLLLSNSTLIDQLQNDEQFNLAFLEEKHQISPEKDMVDLFNLSKVEFESGNYAAAQQYLLAFKTLAHAAQGTEKLDKERVIKAAWGKLAADILVAGSSKSLEDWAPAANTLSSLRMSFDGKNTSLSPFKMLIQRTWLIHWALFVYFFHPEGTSMMLEHFFEKSEIWLHTVQINAPYLLRYLAVAVVVNPRTNKQSHVYMKELVKILQHEDHHRDPCTEFLIQLYVNYDFETALDQLNICKDVLKNDFFLNRFLDDFVENARLYTFETYCKIHSKIDIGYLKEKLNFDQNRAEKWIITLIHQAKMDATIDSDKNQIIMKPPRPSLYQSILSHAKETLLRTNQMTSALSKIAQDTEAD